jgi:hypothetical protein
MVRVNFDVELPRVGCNYLSVDVDDVLGRRRNNITHHVQKWKVDPSTGEVMAYVETSDEQPKFREGVCSVCLRSAPAQRPAGADAVSACMRDYVWYVLCGVSSWCVRLSTPYARLCSCSRLGVLNVGCAVEHSGVGGSTALNIDTFDNFVSSNQLAVVNFYAPWCHWCTKLVRCSSSSVVGAAQTPHRHRRNRTGVPARCRNLCGSTRLTFWRR